MIAQLRTPTPGFEEVIQTHFYLKQEEILQQVKVNTIPNFTKITLY